MSRQEMEQFVKRFEKAPSREAGPGREIEVKPGQSRPKGPSSDLPDVLSGTRVSEGSARRSGSIPQDELQGLNQGTRSSVPPEFRARYEAYTKSLGRSKVVSPATRPAPAGQPSGAR